MSVLDEIIAELRGGPFSVLSEAAIQRLLDLIRRAMADGYERGLSDGKKLAKWRAK